MTLVEIQNRLDEIANTSLQGLEDSAVLAILEERKSLLSEQAKLEEQVRKEEEERARKAQEEEQKRQAAAEQEMALKKQAILDRLAEINKSITPDADADKLLALVQERKMLEIELKVFGTGSEQVAAPAPQPSPASAPAPEVQSAVSSELPMAKPQEEAPVAEKVPETVVEPKEELSAPVESEKIAINTNLDYVGTHISKDGKVSGLDDGEGRLVLDSSLQSAEYQGYLSELKANLNSLGTFLQGLPVTAKRNRSFMLEVAKIDPAYAMHYADKDTLKKDETFNVAIAGINNQRNTGNPLSEMLPEMRTGAVLLAGVKNDFRNVRFLRPEMAEYEEILTLAKKGALEAVSALKDAHDVKFLIPPVLQKDKEFMKQVEEAAKPV